MVVARRGVVSLDCSDPGPLAEFWAAMLGGEVAFTTPTATGVRTDWVWLAMIAVPDHRPPTWPDGQVPKQFHLDLAVEDLEAAVAEAERLGATPVSFQPAPDRRRILLDPAGHPFCLTTQIPPAALADLTADVARSQARGAEPGGAEPGGAEPGGGW